jgi:hypothetical protein
MIPSRTTELIRCEFDISSGVYASISQRATNIKTPAWSHFENDATALLTELLFRAATLRAIRNIRTDTT